MASFLGGLGSFDSLSDSFNDAVGEITQHGLSLLCFVHWRAHSSARRTFSCRVCKFAMMFCVKVTLIADYPLNDLYSTELSTLMVLCQLISSVCGVFLSLDFLHLASVRVLEWSVVWSA